MTKVNLSELVIPRAFLYTGANGKTVDLAALVRQEFKDKILLWQLKKFLKPTDSFGLAIANLAHAGQYHSVWDDPERLLGFGVGWGDEGDRYIWNAVRKMRATARTGRDTLDIRDCGDEHLFRDMVESNDGPADNPLRWGDFGWGGAVIVGRPPVKAAEKAGKQLIGGVSALKEREDDWVISMVIRFLQTQIHKLDYPELYELAA